MQYKCQICHDTGNKEKDIGGYLTCIACEAPAERMALEAFIESLPAMGEQEQAWAIHQRALAMAPKQETLEPTDISKCLRECAGNPGYSHNDYADTMRAAADEIERYYGDMLNWKKTAEAKDAAPAAANGALTDEQIKSICESTGWIPEWNDRDHIKFARAILAAAGPDAALVDAKPLVDIATAVMSQHGLIDHLSEVKTQAFCDDLRAALSGAKGN